MDPWKASVALLSVLLVILSFLLWKKGDTPECPSTTCPSCPKCESKDCPKCEEKDCPKCEDTPCPKCEDKSDDLRAMTDALTSLQNRSKKMEDAVMGTASIAGVIPRPS